MSLLATAVTRLRERGTPFAVIGAAAMAVHGVSRATRGLDLLVVGPDCLASAYWDATGVARRADLILLKLYAGAHQDAWDVSQLLASAEGVSTVNEVEGRLTALPGECRALWRRIRAMEGSNA